MASTIETTTSADAQPRSPGNPRPRRARGTYVSTGAHESRTLGAQRGDLHRGRGARGRGRGSRGRGSDYTSTETGRSAEKLAPQLTRDPSATDDEGDQMVEELNGTVEAEICFICASEVVHIAVAPCNHCTCHICALRMRALYKNKACAHCRANANYLVFTDESSKKYEDFSATDFARTDDNLGIKYEKTDIFEDTILLLRYNCPDPGCDVACLGWPDLHRHVRSAHHKVMCDLCTRNKKVFTHEHELFTNAELRKHEKFGDDNPGAIDQSGFKGHPECGFCRQRFYGDDELYTHCRDKHERCHICDRRSQGLQQQYFVDYNSLEEHFRKDHFLCLDQECLDKKFVVFDSEMDMQAHQLETHPNGLTKGARRDAQRVAMSSFNFREPHEAERGSRREGRGRGRGRGRDPNVDPLPQSSAQPMRRDAMAYQRQLAIQSAQSVSNRTFGSQLTEPTPSSRTRPEPSNATAVNTTSHRSPEPLPSLASLNLRADGSAERPVASTGDMDLTPQEHARRLRHNAVTERAATLLHNDQSKLADFRSRVSSFRSSAISATELVDSFFALFDASPAALGKLIKELAEIFEIQSKRDSLLKAWSDWKAINEDYPSLPGPTSVAASATAWPVGNGGSRVLRLKNSTAQSSRSAQSRRSAWGSAGSGAAFPATPSRPSASTTQRATSTLRPNPAPSRSISQPPLGKSKVAVNADAFPALPAAARPSTSVFSPGYGGLAVRRDNSGTSTPVSAWGSGMPAAAAGASGNELDDGDTPGMSRKKGNKNKKQTLFKFG